MKKILYLATLLQLIAATGFAQNCLSHEQLKKNLEANPQLRLDMEALEAETQAYIAAHKHDKSVSATKVIPIVFHVIHAGGNENISVAQIRDQVAIMNAEFNRQFADTVKTPAPFKSLAGALAVEFRLATKDPEGNCTQGITRTYHPFTTCSANEEDPKALRYWPREKYLNVWLVSSMHYLNQTQCTGGGYAQFPGGTAKTDGVIIRGDLIGSIGTATQNTGWGNFLGRYLMHELGHWMNLIHIWGDDECGSDLVSDTPPHEGANSNCPAFPRRPNNSCGGDANGEMFTNYMDYTNGPCLNMYSKEQVLRMEACLNSSLSSRNNLWTQANIQATGADVTTLPNCPATPEVFPYVPKIICNSGTVSFRDASYGGTKTSRMWSFPGGTASSLTDSIVNVTYSTPGVYDISLSNTNLNGTTSRTFANRVVVLESGTSVNDSLVFTERFENNPFQHGWVRLNTGADTSWSNTSISSFSGAQSMRLQNFKNVVGGIDELISPQYNFGGIDNISLKFKLAFAKRNNTNKDKLVISLSKDCGQSWTTAYSKSANSTSSSTNLATIPNSITNTFIPTGEDEWREETIGIPAAYRTDNVRIRFTYTCSGGNNLYIDDLKLAGTVTVGNEALTSQKDIELIPNPAEAQLRVVGIETECVLQLLDVQGKEVMTKTVKPGTDIPINMLRPGLYLWRLKSETGVVNGKVVKQ